VTNDSWIHLIFVMFCVLAFLVSSDQATKSGGHSLIWTMLMLLVLWPLFCLINATMFRMASRPEICSGCNGLLIANDAGVLTSSTHTRLKQSTQFSMAPALLQQHPLVQKKLWQVHCPSNSFSTPPPLLCYTVLNMELDSAGWRKRGLELHPSCSSGHASSWHQNYWLAFAGTWHLNQNAQIKGF